MHASIPERIAFGTPLDPVAIDPTIRVVPRATTSLVGRILIAVIFFVAGFEKFVDTAGTIDHMKAVGIPYAGTLIYVAAIAEVLGGLSILLGFLTRVGALGLAIYLIPVTLYFHRFWGVEGAAATMQMSQFMKNVAIMGGLLVLMAFGAGPYSVDQRLRRPMQA